MQRIARLAFMHVATGLAITASCTTVSATLAQSGAAYEEWRQADLAKLPFVQDAIRRWAKKSNIPLPRATDKRAIQIMYFPTKACVQFVFKSPATGGVPIYCYRSAEGHVSPLTLLVEEYSDVD